jgi:carnitine 3-dehydrogenase
MANKIERVAIVGAGVIGSGWAARFLGAGLDVDAWDPAPDARSKAFAAIDRAWPAIARRGIARDASPSRLAFHERLEDCVKGADFIQENAPEREALKQDLLARIDAANAHAIVASSTSGLLPTLLAAKMTRPERMLVGHPFNPVYLLPLVELVGGERTAPATIDRAAAFYRALGMRPLTVRKEIVGFIADRLMEALWREALWLVNDDVATTEEVDAAVVYGCGLRWSLMGTFLTFHLAGGEGGMRHMLHQFGPALKLPWTKLVAPELTDELIDKVADGCADQAAGRSIRELEARRDDFLVELLALVQKYWPEAEGRPGQL